MFGDHDMSWVLRLSVIAGLMSASAHGTADSEFIAISGRAMGTAYTVKLAGVPGRLDERALRADIERILHRVDARMSIYREDSELARFNASSTTEWFSVSAETNRVITEAR